MVYLIYFWLCIHCAAHSLNKDENHASNSSAIRNCMGALSSIYIFNTILFNYMPLLIKGHSINEYAKVTSILRE